MLPSTPKVYRLTKRELFGRRMSMMDRPLIIVNFQDLLGDFAPDKLQQSSNNYNSVSEINLYPGSLEGLKLLSVHF